MRKKTSLQENQKTTRNREGGAVKCFSTGGGRSNQNPAVGKEGKKIVDFYFYQSKRQARRVDSKGSEPISSGKNRGGGKTVGKNLGTTKKSSLGRKEIPSKTKHAAGGRGGTGDGGTGFARGGVPAESPEGKAGSIACKISNRCGPSTNSL